MCILPKQHDRELGRNHWSQTTTVVLNVNVFLWTHKSHIVREVEKEKKKERKAKTKKKKMEKEGGDLDETLRNINTDETSAVSTTGHKCTHTHDTLIQNTHGNSDDKKDKSLGQFFTMDFNKVQTHVCFCFLSLGFLLLLLLLFFPFIDCLPSFLL